ncbi:MAG: hypothetical protein GTO14_24150 [Anaerolineales bacterium]|nr:hypothetical protein [Anaerolineales bacterium]
MKMRVDREPWNLWIGVGLVGLGVLLILGEILNIPMGRFVWPFFVILPGLAFFYLMARGGKSAAPLAIPGSIITMTGLLLLYQSASNHWESWAYAWALIFPTSVGVGLYLYGRNSESPSLRRTGVWLVNAGIILLIAGGIFFEMLIWTSPVRSGRILWPVLIIAFGIFLVIRQFGILAFRRPSEQQRETPKLKEAAGEQEVTPIDSDLNEPKSITNEEE